MRVELTRDEAANLEKASRETGLSRQDITRVALDPVIHGGHNSVLLQFRLWYIDGRLDDLQAATRSQRARLGAIQAVRIGHQARLDGAHGGPSPPDWYIALLAQEEAALAESIERATHEILTLQQEAHRIRTSATASPRSTAAPMFVVLAAEIPYRGSLIAAALVIAALLALWQRRRILALVRRLRREDGDDEAVASVRLRAGEADPREEPYDHPREFLRRFIWHNDYVRNAVDQYLEQPSSEQKLREFLEATSFTALDTHGAAVRLHLLAFTDRQLRSMPQELRAWIASERSRKVLMPAGAELELVASTNGNGGAHHARREPEEFVGEPRPAPAEPVAEVALDEKGLPPPVPRPKQQRRRTSRQADHPPSLFDKDGDDQ